MRLVLVLKLLKVASMPVKYGGSNKNSYSQFPLKYKQLDTTILVCGDTGIVNIRLIILLVFIAINLGDREHKIKISVRAKSRLCDTMYHTDVILNFRQVF